MKMAAKEMRSVEYCILRFRLVGSLGEGRKVSWIVENESGCIDEALGM